MFLIFCMVKWEDHTKYLSCSLKYCGSSRLCTCIGLANWATAVFKEHAIYLKEWKLVYGHLDLGAWQSFPQKWMKPASQFMANNFLPNFFLSMLKFELSDENQILEKILGKGILANLY